MAEKDAVISPDEPTDVSTRALTIGRILDRLCRTPGNYAVMIVVPAHRRSKWEIIFYKVEVVRRIEL